MTKLYGFEVFGFQVKNGSVTLKSGSRSLKVGQCILRSTRGLYLYMCHVCPVDFVCKERKIIITRHCNCQGQSPGFTEIFVGLRMTLFENIVLGDCRFCISREMADFVQK